MQEHRLSRADHSIIVWFIRTPLGRLVLINSGVVVGLSVAYSRSYRGSQLMAASVVSFVLFNAIAVVGIWIGKNYPPKSYPAKQYEKPLWIVIGILWLLYLLFEIFPDD